VRVVGVAADLGYEHRKPGAVRGGMQRFASTKFGAWAFSKTLQPIDQVVRKLSKGRTSAPQVLAGLPVLFVTTTGRKSREPRTAPLIAVPVGDTLALLGTNFGQTSTPAWVFNLEADPTATATYRDAEVDVRARPATDDERDEVWAASKSIYPGYAKYRERITDREIRIFVLEPAAQS
jgi:deazaflavin-dependent oxidoreductase (nitroreductase family)